MLWDIRARMKPALQVIDLIPNLRRTPALAALRRAVLEGRPATLRLFDEDRELAYHDAHLQLTSPIAARVLKMLHDGGHLKLKKPPPGRFRRWRRKSLPSLPFAPRSQMSSRLMPKSASVWPKSLPILPARGPKN